MTGSSDVSVQTDLRYLGAKLVTEMKEMQRINCKV